MTTKAILGASLALAVTFPLGLMSTAGHADPGSQVAAVPTIEVRDTGLATINAVSKKGRYVVGAKNAYGRLQLRDLKLDTRLARLPTQARNPSISDKGRYVSYTLPIGDWGRRDVWVYDRELRTTTRATTTASGKRLVPKWTGDCTEATCEEDQKLENAPQLDGGQISGDGRYVAFCANYRVPTRIDLYVKTLRGNAMRVVKGVCDYVDFDGDSESILAPSISENGNAILLPGRLSSTNAGNTWGPSQVFLDQSFVEVIGGVGPSMTHDGQMLTINGAFAGSDAGGPVAVTWYDVATGTTSPADPPGLRLNMNNSSRHGRYVLLRADSGAGPVHILDRDLGVEYELEEALLAEGIALHDSAARPGNGWIWGHVPNASALSGSGKVAFLQASGRIVEVRWTP